MIIRGSKGGGGSFTQTPDNLRSQDTFEGLLGLCVGPIKGPVRGLKSVKIDGTAIENETGELNYGDFVANFADGDPTKFPQRAELKLGSGATPMPIQVAITNPSTAAGQGTPGPWVTRTLNNTGAAYIDSRFIVQQLWQQTKKGIFTLQATLEIQMKPTNATTWINPTLNLPTSTYNEQGGTKTTQIRNFVPQSYYNPDGTWKTPAGNYAISGKTTSPSVYEVRISVPNEGAYANVGWDIRVRLLERDNFDNGSDTDNIQEKRTVSWESISAVYPGSVGDHEDWRGLSWLQLYGKASDQLTGVPEITGVYDTKIVPVPPSSIFNPATRAYTSGIWDGSWAYAFTNDPAWCLADAISDPVSGLASVALGSYLNKWDALEASKWFSQLVPDGAGGMHPRYSMNLAISESQKAEELIRYMAGAVGGLAWDQGNGEWRLKVDKPETPVDIFTLDNIENEFVYSHTSVDTRFNDIIGKFKNAAMDYREDSVRLFDNQSIANIGRKPTTIALVGCTNRQEALRRVKLRLRTGVNETRMVNFVTNRRGRNLKMLDTILIADGDLGSQDQLTSGRVVKVSADRRTLTVRDPLYLAPGIGYSIRFSVYNPSYAPETTTQPTSADWRKPTVVQTLNLTNTSSQRGSTRTLYLDNPLPVDVATNLSISLDAAGLVTVPKLYRVLNIAVDDDGERMNVNAIEVDTGKWDASDNVSPEDSVFQDMRGQVPMPLEPVSGEILSLHTTGTDSGVITTLIANWQRPPGAFVSGFRVRHGINGDIMTTVIDRTQLTNWELVNPAPGIHYVEISTINRMGLYSPALRQGFLVEYGPDQTAPSLGELWKNGQAVVLGYPYKKGDIVTDQGATWIYTSDAAWDNTMPPDLPAQENAFWRQIKDATTHQVQLDNTSFFVSATSSGAVKDGQLPKSGKATYMVGTTDVSSTATWSIVANNATATIDTDGSFEVTAMGSSTTATIDIQGVYNGISQVKRVTLTKNIDSASGGAGVVSSWPAVSSTSFGADPSTISKLNSSSSGKLKFGYALTYDAPQSSKTRNTFTMAGKIVYRPTGTSSWTDASAAVTGTQASAQAAQQGGEWLSGEISQSVTVTGLTPSTEYEFGLLLRKVSGNVASVVPYGTLGAEAVA